MVCAVIIEIFGLLTFDYKLFALGTLVALVTVLSLFNPGPDIKVNRGERRLRVFEGDKRDVDLSVLNRGGHVLVEASDYLPMHARLDNSTGHKLVDLLENERKEAGYRLECPLRGIYNIGPTFLRIYDPGLMAVKNTISRNEEEMPVHITYETIHKMEPRTKRFDWNMGPKNLNIEGNSNEFYAIREYTKEDPYKRINWKASTRLRKLMVNTYERECLTDCYIFLDARHLAGLGTAMENFLESAVRLAFGTAQTIHDRNFRVGLVTYGQSVYITPAGMGRNHIDRLQSHLLAVKPGGMTPFSYAFWYTRPWIRPNSTVILFSPLDNDATFYDTAIDIMGYKMDVVLVTASTMRYEAKALDIKKAKKMSVDSIMRKNAIKTVEDAGVRVVTFTPKTKNTTVLKRISSAMEVKTI